MTFDFKQWYEKHGTDLNKDRRERYAKDPAYRDRVRQLNADSRARKREDRQAEARATAQAQLTGIRPQPWKEIDVERENPETKAKETVRGFTIGALAAATKRSIQALRMWERSGLIPKPDLQSPKGDRLYTVDLIERIVRDLEAKGRLKETGRQRRGIPTTTKRVQFANGETREVVLFTVASLAKVMRKTVVTVQQMEERNELPETPFRATERHYRLYTLEQVLAVVGAQDLLGRGTQPEPDALAKFYAAVTEEWKALGVMDAKLIEE
jgi:DNA-binding transcriptional MerR regulator